ncbi:UDP-3-O-acylglucosamine N-acyltransferase [uncultured Alphaproteobacteria bacterium]|uniref:UDP-3-O-acylglucosamine N-acyltransferase n=1 Tax=uncultured Alphaproteobacteria bacterium TaxID=91750 RepID=A0A212J876_9PROT|nr:UDP-3-O-acylglucosamine N-acyltransferase [uncultured Alphaproteobacteria bacterium]
MTDSRFYRREGPFSLARLAELSGAELSDAAMAERSITDVAPLYRAGAEDISFLDNRKYVQAFEASAAGACVVHPELADRAPAGMGLLVTPEPYRAYALIAHAFYPQTHAETGISPQATIDPSAKIGRDVRIEAGAVICARAEVGDRCHICAGAVLRDGVTIGDDCYVGSNAVLSYAIVGNKVWIHAGAAIGQDGFGFAMGPKGHLKVPQLGRVIIHDDVEIGANTTIDRGAGPDTVIGEGCRIDNLVQIGHNVELGRGCVLVAQVGVSGSTRFADFVVAGGQAGITGHLKIGPGARIGAQSGVMRDVPAGQTVIGSPAVPAKEHWRQIGMLERLAKKHGA